MSKPMGAIPAAFSAVNGPMLKIAGRAVDVLISDAGDTPLFVYDLAMVDARIATLECLKRDTAVVAETDVASFATAATVVAARRCDSMCCGFHAA